MLFDCLAFCWLGSMAGCCWLICGQSRSSVYVNKNTSYQNTNHAHQAQSHFYAYVCVCVCGRTHTHLHVLAIHTPRGSWYLLNQARFCLRFKKQIVGCHVIMRHQIGMQAWAILDVIWQNSTKKGSTNKKNKQEKRNQSEDVCVFEEGDVNQCI